MKEHEMTTQIQLLREAFYAGTDALEDDDEGNLMVMDAKEAEVAFVDWLKDNHPPLHRLILQEEKVAKIAELQVEILKLRKEIDAINNDVSLDNKLPE